MGSSTLITGAGGFVGPYLTELLARRGEQPVCQVRNAEKFRAHFERLIDRPLPPEVKVVEADLCDPASLSRIFAEHSLGAVVHLAGKSFVPDCWKNPARALEINGLGSARMLQAARENDWAGTFLLVSTGQVYGAPPPADLPLRESSPLAPDNPYSVSKLTAEHFAAYYQSDSIRVIIARPFNHIGPGQNQSFVVPAFLKRIREAVDQGQQRIVVGDLDSSRDFTDVRDVVEAYALLLDKGQPDVYNVCSGRTATIGEILKLAQAAAGSDLEVRQDADLLRPEGSTVHYGVAEKLNALGWQPRISLRQSIEDAHALLVRRGGIPA